MGRGLCVRARAAQGTLRCCAHACTPVWSRSSQSGPRAGQGQGDAHATCHVCTWEQQEARCLVLAPFLQRAACAPLSPPTPPRTPPAPPSLPVSLEELQLAGRAAAQLRQWQLAPVVQDLRRGHLGTTRCLSHPGGQARAAHKVCGCGGRQHASNDRWPSSCCAAPFVRLVCTQLEPNTTHPAAKPALEGRSLLQHTHLDVVPARWAAPQLQH